MCSSLLPSAAATLGGEVFGEVFGVDGSDELVVGGGFEFGVQHAESVQSRQSLVLAAGLVSGPCERIGAKPRAERIKERLDELES